MKLCREQLLADEQNTTAREQFGVEPRRTGPLSGLGQ